MTTKSNEEVCTRIKTRESIGACEDYHIWYTGEIRMVTIVNPMLSHILTDQTKGNLVTKDGNEMEPEDVLLFRQFARQAGLSLDKVYSSGKDTIQQALSKLQSDGKSPSMAHHQAATNAIALEDSTDEWHANRILPIIKLE